MDIINNSDFKISNYIDLDYEEDDESEHYYFESSFFSINLDLIFCNENMINIYIFSYPNYERKMIFLGWGYKSFLFVDNFLLFFHEVGRSQETHIYDIQKMKVGNLNFKAFNDH